jgi:DNA-binding PadR family transcriptional regulator
MDDISATPSPISTRLKFFLARHVESRRLKKSANIREQPASVLAALMWMEESGIELHQKELGRLLEIGTEDKQTQLSTVFRKLLNGKLVEVHKSAGSKKWYRITAEGRRAVDQFADAVLGIPQEVEEALRDQCKIEYESVIAVSDSRIKTFLETQFNKAKKSPISPQVPGSA